MKHLFSFSITSTFTFILSMLAILVIAVSAPGTVQAVLGPGMASTSPDSQPGSAIQASPYYGPVVNPAANFGSLTDNGTAAYMGIGIASPVSPLHIYSTTSTQPETIDLDGAQPITAQWNDYSNTGGAFSGSGFLARFARNTRASPVNVQAGDRLGFNVFGGWAGGAFRHTGAIEAIVDTGTVSASSLPTYIKFSTTPSGSVSRAERMRIGADGKVAINASSDPDSLAQLYVYNDGLDGRAITGNAPDSTGVVGTGYYGVFGQGSIGVYGKTNSSYGVYGENTYDNTTGYLAGPYGVYSNAGAGGTGWAGRFDGMVYARDSVGIGTSFPSVPNSKLQVGGAIATAVTYKNTGPYTLTANDSVITADASSGLLVIYLPPAVNITGRTYTIKKIDGTANYVMVDGNAAETIDGVLNDNLTAQYKFVTVVSNGSLWYIIGKN